jgi:predicted ArsR family transcriptional regulator
VAAVSTSGQLELLKALGDNTRYAIYLHLASASSARTTTEIAGHLGLHPNTVRPHLERLREVGLLAVRVDGRGEVGRPQHRYSLTADAPSLGLEPPVVNELSKLVLSMARRLGAAPGDSYDVGFDRGADRAVHYADAPSTLEALVAELDRLGFDPAVFEGDDVDTAVVSFTRCPFQAQVDEYPDLICSLHHGLVSGLIEEMGDAAVAEFCDRGHRTPCRVAVRSR